MRMDLPTRMKTARKQKGWSQVELARACGLKQGAIGHLESGRSGNSMYLPQIASALQVSYEWLLRGKGEMHVSARPSVDSGLRQVPLRSLSDFSGRSGMNAVKNWVPAPTDVSKDAFAVTVEGDAMTSQHGQRSYPNGTIIYVDPDMPENLNGKRVLAMVDDYPVFKEYRRDGSRIFLMSLNPLYPPIDGTTAKIIGVVVGSFLPE